MTEVNFAQQKSITSTRKSISERLRRNILHTAHPFYPSEVKLDP